MTEPYDYITAITTYEEGYLDQEGKTKLFQYLVDTGLAWTLQGHYGREATRMIEEGEING